MLRIVLYRLNIRKESWRKNRQDSKQGELVSIRIWIEKLPTALVLHLGGEVGNHVTTRREHLWWRITVVNDASGIVRDYRIRIFFSELANPKQIAFAMVCADTTRVNPN